MTPAPCCHLATHAEATLINAHIASDTTSDVIAGMYDLTPEDVDAHRQHLVDAPKACSCKVGSRPDLALIDSTLRSGGALGTLARRTGASKTTLRRHRNTCLGITSDEPAEGSTENGPPMDPPVQPTPPAPEKAVQPTPVAPSVSVKVGDGASEVVALPISQGDSRAREKSHAISAKKPTSPDIVPPITKAVQGAAKGSMDPSPAKMDPPAPTVDPHASWKADADSPYPPRPVTRKGRVEAVETMMVDLTWEKGVTGPLLAAYWKLHPTTVADIAAEAWRNVQRDLDPDMVKKKLSNAFRRGVDRADLTGDVKGLASVGKAWADVAGITSSGTNVAVNILNDPALVGVLRVYRLVLDALDPGMSEILAEAVKLWTAGGPSALKAFVEGQIQRMQLEAGDADAITVEAGAPDEPTP